VGGTTEGNDLSSGNEAETAGTEEDGGGGGGGGGKCGGDGLFAFFLFLDVSDTESMNDLLLGNTSLGSSLNIGSFISKLAVVICGLILIFAGGPTGRWFDGRIFVQHADRSRMLLRILGQCARFIPIGKSSLERIGLL